MRTPLIALCAISIWPMLAAGAWRLPPPGDAVMPGEVLVRFKSGGDGLPAKSIKARLGLVRGEPLLSGAIERLQLPGYLDVHGALAQLEADPDVLWAEPNFLKRKGEVLPNDPRFGEQWPLKNTGQTGSDGTGVAGADLATTFANDANNDGVADRTDSSSVTLALIDDGFELNHADLAANFIAGRDFLRNGGEDADPSPASSNDTHGTLVAGSAGAVGNNGIGIAAPAWKTRLLPIRFGFDTASLVKAFDHARTQGAKVVSASFGGPEFSNAERDAIQALSDADVLLVASAGNLDSNTDFAKAAYPANYDLPNVLAVAATNRRDALAGFTQYGPVTVDVAAPGVRVLTTAVGNGYATVTGTSFSAPYTAAVAALIRARYPNADVSEVKARLIEGAARPQNTGSTVAGGRVDADASLDLAARPSLVIAALRFDDSATGDGDGALDPGENLVAEVTVRNLWSPASGVSATLSSTSGNLDVGTAAIATAAIGKGGSVALRFPFTVASAASGHEIVDFTLRLTAAGGYSAERAFNAELGRLQDGAASSGSLSTSAKDEFETWQFDLPPSSDTARRLIVSSAANRDIDILVKQGSPPQYEISLDVDPESGEQTFFSDVPRAQLGGGADGNEQVTITNPAAGPWFVTVINYTQTANQIYNLGFSTSGTPPPVAAPTPSPAPPAGSSDGDGGGGAFGALLPLWLAALFTRAGRVWRLASRLR